MDSFLDPGEVLNKLNLKSNMMAADFGCGSGGFTIPLAEKLEEGLVYALDIQELPLSALKGRSISENVSNIRFIRTDLEKPKGSTLLDSFLDLVVISNTLFQIEDKNAIMFEAERVLKKRGLLLIVDWLPEVSQGPIKGRVSVKDVKKIAEKLKFKFKKESKAGKYHYSLIFEKT